MTGKPRYRYYMFRRDDVGPVVVGFFFLLMQQEEFPPTDYNYIKKITEKVFTKGAHETKKERKKIKAITQVFLSILTLHLSILHLLGILPVFPMQYNPISFFLLVTEPTECCPLWGFSLNFLIGKIKEWKHKRKMERDKRGVGLLGHYEVQMD